MISLYEARRNSFTLTENSVSRKDKRMMKKIEKQIDQAIIRAGDCGEMNTTVSIYFECQNTDLRVYQVSELQIIEDMTLLKILIERYKIQGYNVSTKEKVLSKQGTLFDKYSYSNKLILELTIKWDKDYTMEKLKNKYD